MKSITQQKKETVTANSSSQTNKQQSSSDKKKQYYPPVVKINGKEFRLISLYDKGAKHNRHLYVGRSGEIYAFAQRGKVNQKPLVKVKPYNHESLKDKWHGGGWRYLYYGSFTIHRLVALLWVPGRTLFRNQVDHIDGNPHNNHADNLRWVTNAENAQYRKQQKAARQD